MPHDYDDLAALYHLFFDDWDESMARQGAQLASIVRARWPAARSVLDVTCGIGTQSIALSMQGFEVRGSDVSAKAVKRAGAEAAARGQAITFSVCDARAAHVHHGGRFDLVVSCDNSIPHLLDDAQVLAALAQMHACLRPGGGCLLTVRDYDREPRGRDLVVPHGVRLRDGRRYVGYQVRDHEGDRYDLAVFWIEEELATGAVRTHVMRSRYYAIGTRKLLALMTQAGFEAVSRLDDVFYQPVFIGTRAPGR